MRANQQTHLYTIIHIGAQQWRIWIAIDSAGERSRVKPGILRIGRRSAERAGEAAWRRILIDRRTQRRVDVQAWIVSCNERTEGLREVGCSIQRIVSGFTVIVRITIGIEYAELEWFCSIVHYSRAVTKDSANDLRLKLGQRAWGRAIAGLRARPRQRRSVDRVGAVQPSPRLWIERTKFRSILFINPVGANIYRRVGRIWNRSGRAGAFVRKRQILKLQSKFTEAVRSLISSDDVRFPACWSTIFTEAILSLLIGRPPLRALRLHKKSGI